MIKQKYVRNINKYLLGIKQGDMFYIIKRTTENDKRVLVRYGLNISTQVIPRPIFNATTKNAEGCWEVYKNLPKEPRTIFRDYHIVDWHGNDHYGISCQIRQCYQRKRVNPTCYELSVFEDCVMSPLLKNSPDQIEKNILLMNIFLEIFSECEIVTEEKKHPFSGQLIRRVPWEILPPGEWPWEKGEQGIKQILAHVPKRQKIVIGHRHEVIHKLHPDFCAVGRDVFWGYLVYGFTKQKLYVFESSRYDNATYIFRGSWEEASKLTKQEIIGGHLHECRLYHTNGWEENIKHWIE